MKTNGDFQLIIAMDELRFEYDILLLILWLWIETEKKIRPKLQRWWSKTMELIKWVKLSF